MTDDPSSPPVIALDQVNKHFGKTKAVADLSMTIDQGQSFGFLGPNGAGKSTTLKMLVGVLQPDSGNLRVLGEHPSRHSLATKRRIGYVPEQHFTPRWMRVGEAIAFCKRFYPSWNDPLCHEWLERFALTENAKVGQLSKGMVVKLSLLLAIAHDPDVLILDEPMAGLDPVARDEVLEGVLGSLADRGQTLIFSSHTLSDVQRVAETVGIINEGRLLVKASTDELLKTTKRLRAVLIDGGGPPKPPDNMICQRVNAREWLVTVRDFTRATVERMRETNNVERVDVIDINLEDIFKDYIRGERATA